MQEFEGDYDPRENALNAQRRALEFLSEHDLTGAIDSLVSDVNKDPMLSREKKDMIAEMGLALRNDPKLNGEKVQKFILDYDPAAREVAQAAVHKSMEDNSRSQS